MPKLTQDQKTQADAFLAAEWERTALVNEIMTLTERLAKQRPDLVDELVNQIIPDGWEPTKAN